MCQNIHGLVVVIQHHHSKFATHSLFTPQQHIQLQQQPQSKNINTADTSYPSLVIIIHHLSLQYLQLLKTKTARDYPQPSFDSNHYHHHHPSPAAADLHPRTHPPSKLPIRSRKTTSHSAPPPPRHPTSPRDYPRKTIPAAVSRTPATPAAAPPAAAPPPSSLPAAASGTFRRDDDRDR